MARFIAREKIACYEYYSYIIPRMSSFTANKFISEEHRVTYFDKLNQLLSSSTYCDVVIHCKDGYVEANRLVLATFSTFLDDVFKRNFSMNTFHATAANATATAVETPFHEDANETGCSEPSSSKTKNEASVISLPNVYMKDAKCLLQVVNNISTTLELYSDDVNGLDIVAKKLKIQLVMSVMAENVYKIYAVPKKLQQYYEHLIKNRTYD
ncbi:hypothetical protein B4U80_13798 [Leptotrombidium deliense]|uniref:BTB domain-containing protein n=1 Tax=Leptotrombidium deliense TaxID=299467 RepID=A0A443SDP1_9ACAR|nr:hypothetical protein B4U80_13798 [Leptotrombidium deliense]